MNSSRKVVTKRRPFVSEPESESSSPSLLLSTSSSSSYSLLPSVRVIRGSRVALVVMLVLVSVAAYGVLEYWFVVTDVYYSTLEKVQGCVPRNLELVNELLDAEYDGYMKDELCDSHILQQDGAAARRADATASSSSPSLSSASASSSEKRKATGAGAGLGVGVGKTSWRSKIDAEQQQQIDKMKRTLPKVYIYEPQIDLLVAHMNFLNGNGNGGGGGGDGGGTGFVEDEGEATFAEDDDDDQRKKDKGRPCEVFLFHDLIKRNITGTLVDTLEDADRIYVPFLYQCKVESGIDWYKSSGIDRLYKELKRSEIGLQNRMHDVFIFSHRHYTQRTGFGLSMREILKKYEFTIISPEVTNLQMSEVETGANWLYKHIVLPQVPLLSWTLPDALSPSHREYKFCFMGSLINNERRAMVDVMLKRKDSLVVTACRDERKNLNRRLRKRNASTILYRHCDMCMVPLGDSLSDRRLFDAANAGCVPIVTQPLRPLPFPLTPKKKGGGESDASHYSSRYVGSIDWHSAVLRAPIADTTEKSKRLLSERLNELANLSAASMRNLRSNVLAAATKFSFSGCGGYYGLLLTLQRLNQQRMTGVTVPMDLYALLLNSDTPSPAPTNHSSL